MHNAVKYVKAKATVRIAFILQELPVMMAPTWLTKLWNSSGDQIT